MTSLFLNGLANTARVVGLVGSVAFGASGCATVPPVQTQVSDYQTANPRPAWISNPGYGLIVGRSGCLQAGPDETYGPGEFTIIEGRMTASAEALSRHCGTRVESDGDTRTETAVGGVLGPKVAEYVTKCITSAGNLGWRVFVLFKTAGANCR